MPDRNERSAATYSACHGRRSCRRRSHAISTLRSKKRHGEHADPEEEGVEKDPFHDADARHTEAAGTFERKLVTLPKLFENGPTGGDWPAEKTETAAAIVWRTSTESGTTTN